MTKWPVFAFFLKYAFSSDEWLFFFRKMIATFSANGMIKRFLVSLAAESVDFALTTHDSIQPQIKRKFLTEVWKEISRPNS